MKISIPASFIAKNCVCLRRIRHKHRQENAGNSHARLTFKNDGHTRRKRQI